MQVKMKTGATVEVPDAHFITIPEGLFGFETYTRYAIVESGIEPFLWLQSTEDSALAFLIVDPFLACAEYEADIDDESLKKIGVTSPEDIVVMSVVTIPGDGTAVTANLLGPLVINRANNRCVQVVLSDSRWTTKFPLGA